MDPQHIPGLDNPANSDTKYESEAVWKRDMLFKAGMLVEPFKRYSLVKSTAPAGRVLGHRELRAVGAVRAEPRTES